MIVDRSEPVTLIGGAKVSRNMMDCALRLAPYLVAADGGADTALAHGQMPKAVIGDMDSISRGAASQIASATQHRIEEQDTTDFDKCLRNIRAPLIIGLGFAGDRLHHQLAAFNTLVRHPHQHCLLLGETDLAFLAPPSVVLEAEAGCDLSLFPLGAVEGVSEGLTWPINGLNFAPDGRVGTSNRVSDNPVRLNMTAPKMMVILPETMLESAVRALLATRSRWPAC